MANVALLVVVHIYLASLMVTAIEPNYESLFTGLADLGTAKLSGDLYWTSADGELRAYVFYGIKYGSSKRFEHSWINTDFTYLTLPGRNKFGPQCMQPGGAAQGHDSPNLTPNVRVTRATSHRGPGAGPALEMSEDCLFLDVYIPPVSRNQRQLSTQKRPVVFFTPGGAFVGGNKSPGIGTEISRVSNIIFVSVQYRLGMFGFMATDDVNSPGNYGLGDVKLALRWVRQNVEAFGGDPERITIMGQSAGSMLTSAMMLDPEVRNMAYAVVLMSGSVLSPMAITQTPRTNAAVVATFLRCPTSSTTEMVLCFKMANAQDIVSATDNAFPSVSRGPGEEKFTMVIDGNHIPYKPEWVMQSQPWYFRGGFLNGFMSEDSSLLMQGQWPEIFTTGKPTLTYIRAMFIPLVLRSITGCMQPPLNVIEAVYNRYGFAASTDLIFLRKQLISLTTDIMWRAPSVKEAALYAEKNLTTLGNQLYVVSYDDNIGENIFGVSGLGAFHGLDIQYLFAAPGTPNMLGNKTNERITRQMRLLLSYVANYGTAFGDQFDVNRNNFLQLGHEQTWTKHQDGNFGDLVPFWNKITAVGCTVGPTIAPSLYTAAAFSAVNNHINTRNNQVIGQAMQPSNPTSWPMLSANPGGGFPAFPIANTGQILPVNVNQGIRIYGRNANGMRM